MKLQAGRRWRDQIPTQPVSIEEIMGSREFTFGVADARAGRPYRDGYQSWDIDGMWFYERGRQWARLVPRNITLKRADEVTAEAIAWFHRVGRFIL